MLDLVLIIAGLYLAFGFVFGVAFMFAGGAAAIDHAAAGSGWGFRLIVLPGAAALWPMLAKRWRRSLS